MDGKLHSTSYRELGNLSEIVEYYRGNEVFDDGYQFTDSYVWFRNIVTKQQQDPEKGKEYYPVTMLWGHPGDDIIVGNSTSPSEVIGISDNGLWFSFGFLPTISSDRTVIHTRCFDTIEEKNEFIDISTLALSDKYRHFEIINIMNMVSHDKEKQ